MGLLNIGPAFSALAVPAMDMVWITTLAALATACVMYSLVFVCSPAFFASFFDCFLCSAFESALEMWWLNG